MHTSKGADGLLLAAYSVPYAFFAVMGDAVFGTLWLYGVMIAALTLLGAISIKTHRVPVLLGGNAMSLLTSFAAAWLVKAESMGAYFKPFTLYSLMLFLSVAAGLIQIAAVLWVRLHAAQKN